jgi:hypothetical protein
MDCVSIPLTLISQPATHSSSRTQIFASNFILMTSRRKRVP